MSNKERLLEVTTKFGCTYVGIEIGTSETILVLNKTVRVIAVPNLSDKNVNNFPIIIKHSLMSNKSVANISKCDIVTKIIITDEKLIELYNQKINEFGYI